MRNLTKVLIRAGVSICLLALLLFSIDMLALVDAITRVRLLTVFLSLGFISVGVWVSVFKWQAFLDMHNINHGLKRLLRLYLIGIFFNNLLPTSVGGDFVKATLASRGSQLLPEVLSTIFAERFSGLIAVACYGAVGVFLVPGLLHGAGLGITCFFVACMFLVVLMLWNKSRLLIIKCLPEKLGDIYGRCILSLKLYAGSNRVLVRAMWTSFLFQLLVTAVYFIVAKDLGIGVSFGSLLTVVSLVTLLTILPISLNGLGLREGGFVYLLGYVGVTSHEAIALSLIVYALVLFFSFLGWVAFARWQRDEIETLDEIKCQ